MNLWTITDIGAVRQQNQDFCRTEVLADGQMLLIACDGMGGARAGNVASELAAQAFGDVVLEGLSDPERSGDIKRLLEEAVEIANHAVWHRSGTDPDCLGMGTTLVAALVRGKQVTVANVGDSRAYAVNEEGIRQVTTDHSIVQMMVQRGELTPEQAKSYPGKNLITRAIGTETTVQSDVFPLDLERDDVLLLCTDGLSNLLADQELLFEIVHRPERQDCCQRLLDIAKKRGAPDNVTCVLQQV